MLKDVEEFKEFLLDMHEMMQKIYEIIKYGTTLIDIQLGRTTGKEYKNSYEKQDFIIIN